MTTAIHGTARFRLRAVAYLLTAAFAAPIVLFGLLVIAELVPDRRVIEALDGHARDGRFQTNYVLDAFGGVQDKFTECLGLTYGLGGSRDEDILQETARGNHMLRSDCDSAGESVELLSQGVQIRGEAYFRYWHGYAVLTRPMLATLGISGLRLALAFLLAGAGAFAVVQLARSLGWPASIALLLPVVTSTNVLTTPFAAMTHAISWIVILVGTGVTAAAARQGGITRIACSAAAAGGAFCYFDLLTTPAVPWALATFVITAVSLSRTMSPKAGIVACVASAASWALGFGWTWLSKWLITAFLLGGGTLIDVATAASFRVSGEAPGYVAGLGRATVKNFGYWLALTPIATLLFVVSVAVSIIAYRRLRQDLRSLSLILIVIAALPLLIVPVWYEVFANHSQVHVFFTYRAVPVALGIATAAPLVFSPSPSSAIKPPRRPSRPE